MLLGTVFVLVECEGVEIIKVVKVVGILVRSVLKVFKFGRV